MKKVAVVAAVVLVLALAVAGAVTLATARAKPKPQKPKPQKPKPQKPEPSPGPRLGGCKATAGGCLSHGPPRERPTIAPTPAPNEPKPKSSPSPSPRAWPTVAPAPAVPRPPGGCGGTAMGCAGSLRRKVYCAAHPRAPPCSPPRGVPVAPPLKGSPAPATINNMKGRFPDKISAPYVDTSTATALESCPAKYVCLAFVLAGGAGAGGGAAAWNGTDGIQLKYCTDLIARLRRGGGDAIVSFGGQAGTELAHAISDPARLAAAYGGVVDALQLGWADFDIEGASIEDRPVVARRMAAIKILQARHPGLVVSFTLPVMPTGLTASGVDFAKAAVAAGVRVDVVNIMCMDYGDSFRGDQGAHAIAAAKATRAQLLAAGLPGTKLGITPMIGVNDTPALVFTLEHARAVAAFARATPWVRWLSFWSLGRDNGSGGVGGAAKNDSSGVAQKTWDFTRALTM